MATALCDAFIKGRPDRCSDLNNIAPVIEESPAIKEIAKMGDSNPYLMYFLPLLAISIIATALVLLIVYVILKKVIRKYVSQDFTGTEIASRYSDYIQVKDLETSTSRLSR